MNTKKKLLEVGFWLFCGLYLYLYIEDPLQRLAQEDNSLSGWLLAILVVAYIIVYKRDIDPEKKKIYKRLIALAYPFLLCLLYFIL